jgi:hypothetical protein
VGWYYCEKDGEGFDDACDDGIDNDGIDGIDCEDPKCWDCTVCQGKCENCEGTGVDCEDGCRYGVEITDRAKRLATGHFLSVQCLQRFRFEDQNCQEDTRTACNDNKDNDGNGVWDCADTLDEPNDPNPHLPDPNCCPMVNRGGTCELVNNGAHPAVYLNCNATDANWRNVDACIARAKELGCNMYGGSGGGGDTGGADTGTN